MPGSQAVPLQQPEHDEPPQLQAPAEHDSPVVQAAQAPPPVPQ